MRLAGLGKSELRERAAHPAAGKAQDIFRQTMGGIDVGLAKWDLHATESASGD